MAKNSIRDFDATSSNNTDIQSVDISEGCSPAGINNAIRELMTDLKNVSAGTIALESPSADSMAVTGDLTVDTSSLKVDSTNNRVGVGTASPDTALHVIGAGVPIEVNSSNSNSFKQEFSDNGTTRGFVGANSTNAFMVGDASGNTLFRVASTGLLGIPNLPAFQATGTGLMAFSGAAALADLVLSSAYVNNGSDYNTTTGKFTCPVAGIYLFFASVTSFIP